MRAVRYRSHGVRGFGVDQWQCSRAPGVWSPRALPLGRTNL